MMAGPKNHCVTNTHHRVTNPQRMVALTLCSTLAVAGCVKRKAKNATVIHAQPLLTKNTLKTLFFRAKVRWCEGRVLDVGLGNLIVGSSPGLGRDQGEERAEEEEDRVCGEQETLGRGREVRRVAGL